MSLGDWFIVSIDYLLWCEQKGWNRGRYIHPKGENSMAVSGFGCKISQ